MRDLLLLLASIFVLQYPTLCKLGNHPIADGFLMSYRFHNMPGDTVRNLLPVFCLVMSHDQIFQLTAEIVVLPVAENHRLPYGDRNLILD